MSSQGALLQNYNTDIILCLEKLKKQREDLYQQILKEEESKRKIEVEISNLSSKLDTLQNSLNKKKKSKMEYDQLIQQTENAYAKILESSQTLLKILTKEGDSLNGNLQ
ncbi:putative 13 KDA deflagellation-inducible protein [Neocallimastix lanati (nom. inval.)]|uniref:Putative 13 kDa deflagellation-inducible protein n=1 Tax=Neocallimastix californiae TaxID=1754190 RepID=A0A1Y2EMA5_9FUNG|nr:putative 13 KDA deflagellation-inducible protein [Neocallimastix sp. JGI-2020a]ORY72649.1 putative 13 KDA deflagellation-inducible protein [Neocallimastix californiae]|eukprot:ORY72649.1 putative 13 KDA deflagellation-inducible protein [Neocallimastix californiae]